MSTRDEQKPEFFQNTGFGSNPGFDLNYLGFLDSYWFLKMYMFSSIYGNVSWFNDEFDDKNYSNMVYEPQNYF